MVLEINNVKWHLHFSLSEPSSPWNRGACRVPSCVCHNSAEAYDCKDCGCKPLLWYVTVNCLVHTGVCVMSTDNHCVNGSVGIAHCSHKDAFVRAVGHKMALARAIRHIPLPTREAIWAAYWQKVRRPKESSAKFRARTGKAA